MELVTLWMGIGFLFVGYSVIANDSVQTLGTWIASNNEKSKLEGDVGNYVICFIMGIMVWLVYVRW